MGTTAEHPGKDSSQPVRTLLDIQIRFLPRLPLVRLSGTLVADGVSSVRDALNVVLTPVGQATLAVLDLRRLAKCDGLATAGLARLLAQLSDEGKEVRVQGPPDLVTEIEQRAATWTDTRSAP
jgi:ABC-type transporter Mla MlaB component